ncbi:MAG: isoprenylcysteine carboxylmethyltransferase family protein [bacterium]
MKTIVKKFAVVVVILGLLFLVIRGDFLSPSPFVIGGQLLALAILVSARVAFGRQDFRIGADPGSGQLISDGPYRFIRHPMYAGALLLIWASIAGHWSLVNAVDGVIVSAVALYRVVLEEEALKEHYSDYAEYSLHTRRLIPFLF